MGGTVRTDDNGAERTAPAKRARAAAKRACAAAKRTSAAAGTLRETARGAGRRAGGRRPATRLGRWPERAIRSAAFALLTGCAGVGPGGAGMEPGAPAPPSSGGAADPAPRPVETPPPVPKPAPGRPVAAYSIAVEDVPVRELMFALARDAGLDADIDPRVEGRVTMNAVDETLPDLLERVSRHADVRFELERGVLSVRPDEPVLRTYPIDYVHLDRDTETANEVGTGLGAQGLESPVGEENGSTASVAAKAEHRFWDRLVEAVRAVLGEPADGGGGDGGASYVLAHRETSLLAVRARAARHREVAALLDHILASARRQVLIEATIVEVGLDDRFRAGVDFSRMFSVYKEDGLEVDAGLLGGNLGSPPFVGLSLPDLSLTIRLLSEFGEVRVLSTPLVMALNNRTAIVKVAENRAFFTSKVQVTTSDAAVERNVQTTLHTVPIGLILLVTPTVAQGGEVILKVRPTVTREVGFVIDPNPELAREGVVSRIPELAVRELESVLRLRSGEVAVLGGLMREESREQNTGVPFLSRLPGIGAAFRYRDRSQDKSELIVFLRPTVVGDPSLDDGGLERFRKWWRMGGRLVPAPQRTQPARQPAVAGGLRIERAWGGSPADALLERAWRALRRGDHGFARAAYREVLEARPREALAGLGALAVREGRRDAARGWYRRLLALDPDHETARAMAVALERGGGPGERERALRRELARAPEAAYLQVALGNALALQERWPEAEEVWRAARDLAPANPDPVFNLAVGAERSGRPVEAVERYREALELAALEPAAFDVRAARERIAALTERERAQVQGQERKQGRAQRQGQERTQGGERP